MKTTESQSKTQNFNGVEITVANFPGDDGTGMNITRRVRGYGIVTITHKGFVNYKEDAEADAEICGRIGRGDTFSSEADLMAFIAAEFEA